MKSLLLISPPKSGTTWIRENMSKVTGIPMEKETPYEIDGNKWSVNSLNCFLTNEHLENWKSLKPRVLFFFREPISRYWSFVKHNFRFRENYFSDPKFHDVSIENVSVKDWTLAAFHPMSIAHANYDEIYHRATRFFPDNDIRIEFFDSIVETPTEFIKKLANWVEIYPEEIHPTPPVNEGNTLSMPPDLGKLFLDLSVCSFSNWKQGQFMSAYTTQFVFDQFAYYKGH